MAKKEGGLSPEHHGELNKLNVVPERYDALRAQYSSDPRALQQIDVYDPATEYHDKMSLFVQALKSGDTATEAELQAWFDTFYPLI